MLVHFRFLQARKLEKVKLISLRNNQLKFIFNSSFCLVNFNLKINLQNNSELKEVSFPFIEQVKIDLGDFIRGFELKILDLSDNNIEFLPI